MVMNEVFDEWKQNKTRYGYGLYFDEWWERDVTSFVRRDRNRPSVVLWSAGNEIGEQVTIDGVEMVKRIVGIFHREDPTRPVTMGCDRIAANLTGREVGTPPEFLEVLDVAGYNHWGRRRERAEKYYSDDRHAFPKRKFIGTENGVMGGVRGLPFTPMTVAPGVALSGSANRGTDVEMAWRFTRI
jgi:beta-galactosidase